MPQGSSEIFYVREQSPYPYPNSHVFPTHSQCLWPKCSLVMVASPRVLCIYDFVYLVCFLDSTHK